MSQAGYVRFRRPGRMIPAAKPDHPEGKKNMFEFGGLTAVILIVIFILVIGIKTLVIVPQGFEYTRERLGRFSKTMSPGPSWLIPFIDSIGHKINMMEQ